MFSFIFRFCGLIACCLTLIIIILSIIPSSQLQRLDWADILQLDKLGHMLFYGSAFFHFLMYALKTNNPGKGLIFGICLFILGFILEWTQSLMKEGRIFDYFDQLANTAGLSLAWLLFHTFRTSFLKIISKREAL